MPFDYPVFLKLEGVEVLVVGGGPVALRKATALAEAGALVTVIAPRVVDGFAAVAHCIERRRYSDGEAGTYQLVITATDDPAVNAQVAADGRDARVWVNSADDPANCSFILPAVARRGVISVAVSTGGASPALAGRIRREIADRILTVEVEHAAVRLNGLRNEVRAAGGSTELVDWSSEVDAPFKRQPSVSDASTEVDNLDEGHETG